MDLVDERARAGLAAAVIAGLVLFAAPGAAEQPILDLTGCVPAGDVQASPDGNILVVLWECPGGRGWWVRYVAVGSRAAIMAKPAPTPKGTP